MRRIYPCHAIIDLGKTHQITDVYIFDRDQSPGNMNKMEFSAGAPFHWTSLFIDDLPNMDQWNGHSVNVTTRYLGRYACMAGAKPGFPPKSAWSMALRWAHRNPRRHRCISHSSAGAMQISLVRTITFEDPSRARDGGKPT